MPAPVVHFEIGCRDLAKAKAFYGPLLGWEFAEYGPQSAMLSSPQPAHGSIGGHLNALGHEPHNYCLVYALVDDIQATIDHAVKLGGAHIIGPIEIPATGQFAWIRDPEGIMLGLWKALKP